MRTRLVALTLLLSTVALAPVGASGQAGIYGIACAFRSNTTFKLPAETADIANAKRHKADEPSAPPRSRLRIPTSI